MFTQFKIASQSGFANYVCGKITHRIWFCPISCESFRRTRRMYRLCAAQVLLY